MKMRWLTFGLWMLVSSAALAQEFKLAKSTGSIDITELNKVMIEGYAGNEIVFRSRDHDKGHDERAEGLRAIGNFGLEDNTGIGLSVIDNSGVVEVRQLKKMDGPNILIRVPQGMRIRYTHSSPYGSGLELSSLEGEIEVSTVHNKVHLQNVTGSVKVRTVHGDVDGVFGAVKNSISIASTHGHVDVAMPISTKANLNIGTSYGTIFIDPDFEIQMDKTGSVVKYNDKLSGKLNGGGVEVRLSSEHDNVYLRKNN
ncbi:MAG: DUF4097 family beta strand repeat-containing protein [Cyclobacteriaceae bacterium]